MADMIEKFKDHAQRKHLISDGDKILIALSGGADSVMLFHMLLALKEEYHLTLQAFHLNHMMRAAADGDEKFVQSLCEKHGIVCHMYHSDITAVASQLSLTPEEAGRKERYRMIELIMQENKIDKTATAHHLDDNAETVLMRLVRGTGLRGLSGIPVRRGNIIRPLLFLTKKEILAYLKSQQIDFVTDETNFLGDHFRNRIRNEVLPLLEAENPKIAQSIMRLSNIAVQADKYFSEMAKSVPVTVEPTRKTAEYHLIHEMPDVMKEYILREMAAENGVIKDISSEHIDKSIQLINDLDHTVWDLHLPDLTFQRRYDKFIALKEKEQPTEVSFCYSIGASGTYIFPREKFIIKTSASKKTEKIAPNAYIKTVDYDKINNKLFIKSKSEGDSFYPLGMTGRKKIKKYFIDKKIIREDRHKIPILVDGNEVVCILGLEVDDRYKITKETECFLTIEYIPMEG